MHPRRQKLASWIALQTATAAAASSSHAIAELRLFPLREPMSGRSYTVLRLRTRGGTNGYAECPRVPARDIDTARRMLDGQNATRFAVTFTGTALDGAIATAMVDITARIAKTPAYRLLGGPTRTKIRALASLAGQSDRELMQSLHLARGAGYRAFQVNVPPPAARNQGQAYHSQVRTRLEALRAAVGAGADFVLGGQGALTPGDAASTAAELEGFHLLWFDEPCRLSNIATLRKISEESVTPLGFGGAITEPPVFQDLLREGVTDVLRPDITQHGLVRIRHIAALAETWYTAMAPNHEGGPVASAVALHLAASLPNFFIQHVPLPAAEEDRRMRASLASPGLEAVRDGFLALPAGNGFGIEPDEAALERYKDPTA